ncbi:MAG: hypothetical protein KAZ36_12165 [Bacteroidales bacterium]|nr:hypothetical protein [Bacteroidales bacterium]
MKINLFPTKILISVLVFFIILVSSCTIDETPTKTRMEGVWTVKHVYDQSGEDHASQLNFPITAFHLSSDNTVISTAGPLTMFVVYGNSKYVQIAADIDQVFNYAGLDFNGGEFFVEGGLVDRFTLEMKLEGLPGQGALTDLLDMLGVTNDYLDMVIYHKFINVGVYFNEDNTIMTWVFDDQTTAVYNTKDNQGNYLLWNGWPVQNFTRCTIELQKQTKDLQQVVTDAI